MHMLDGTLMTHDRYAAVLMVFVQLRQPGG
jgi:hypothetical protein